MSRYPDNERHWVTLPADFLCAMAFMGQKKPEPPKPAPKPKGKK